MIKTLTLALSVVLLAVATAVAGPYTAIPVVTSGVLTNTQSESAALNRPVGPIPASTVGVQVRYHLMAAGTGTNHFAFQRSYDGTNNWIPVLYVQNVAAGTSTNTFHTNFTIADFGYVRTFVTNAAGATTTNLSVILYHK